MPEVFRNGIRIHYESAGQGCPVVLAHSYLCSGDMWQPQISELSRHCHVINVDIRGHGRSEISDGPFDLYDLVDDYLAVLDHLDIQKAVWAGLSIGGMIALRAAVSCPERVSGLVLLDTHAGSESGFNRIRYRAMSVCARLFGVRMLLPKIMRMFFCAATRKRKPELVREWKDRIAAVPRPTIFRTLSALLRRDSIEGDLDRIRVPALVIVGETDQALPPPCSKVIAAGIPDATFIVIKDAGHLTTLEQPEAVTSAVLSFLGKIGT